MEDLSRRIRRRFDHEQNRILLRQKYQANMIFAHAGGMWRAGPELLSVLSCCEDDHLVLPDIYENPIQVNRKELSDLARQRWQEQMNAWLVEHHDMDQQR